MKPAIFKRIVFGVLASLLVWGAAIAALIVFGTAKPPAPAPAVSSPFSNIDEHALPGLRRYLARDGTELAYREYRTANQQVAVLIHGSSGSSVGMHPIAIALQRAGASVLVPDLRGHGANQPHGDISYVGQLEDDLADFVAARKADFPKAKWTLIGFSSGAAFALRIAAEVPLGQAFDRYILVSPYLRYNAPSVRPAEGAGAARSTWAAASVGRIIGLTMLNDFGVNYWDGLPVLAFPVPANMDGVTQTYSWRLQRNFGAHDDYLKDIRRASRPVQVLVGGADELLDAEKLKIEFHAQRPDTSVVILPGLGHADMVTRPNAIDAIVAAFN
jgi:non-heme chloroperoxidase